MKGSTMKPGRRRVIPGKVEAAEAFARGVLEDAEACLMCGATHGRYEAHHVVEKQRLWQICRWDLGLSDVEALRVVYAPQIGVPLCADETPRHCHVLQTRALERVPGDRIPVDAWLFVVEELGEPGVAALELQHPGARAWHGGDRC